MCERLCDSSREIIQVRLRGERKREYGKKRGELGQLYDGGREKGKAESLNMRGWVG
jgi:hypothetical protein